MFEKFLNLKLDEKIYKEKEKQFQEIERQQQLMKYQQRLIDSGFTVEDVKRIKEFKFYEFLYYDRDGKVKNTKDKIEAVRLWWKEGRKEYPFLIMYGEKGTGKTQLAKRIAFAAFEKNMAVYYIDKKQLDMKLYNFEHLTEFLEYLMSVDLLVIDDLLTGYQTDYKFSQLYTVLDYRYQQSKETVITMNDDIRKYRQEGNDHVNLLADRLNECAWFVYFDYPSLRDKSFLEAARNGDIRHLQQVKKVERKAKEF